jgi:hypothetical protein
MGWVKLDDRAREHRKMIAAGAEACWLWVCGLMYANSQPQKDGIIPAAAVKILFPFQKPSRSIRVLVEVGLWEKVENGYRIHDYHDYQPNAEQAAELSRKRQKAGQKGGLAKATARAKARQTAKQLAKQTPKQVATKQSSKPPSKTLPVPVPVPVRDPPPPLPEDPGPLGKLFGAGPGDRPDVLELHEEWKAEFGYTEAQLRNANDLDAVTLAEALDTYGQEACRLVLHNAKRDGMVSGEADDKRAKHDPISYIFGNSNAFNRILRDARERTDAASKARPVAEVMAEAKQRT